MRCENGKKSNIVGFGGMLAGNRKASSAAGITDLFLSFRKPLFFDRSAVVVPTDDDLLGRPVRVDFAGEVTGIGNVTCCCEVSINGRTDRELSGVCCGDVETFSSSPPSWREGIGDDGSTSRPSDRSACDGIPAGRAYAGRNLTR